MTYKNTLLCFAMLILGLCTITPAFAQDKVYLTSGNVQEGKVTEVGPTQIKMLMNVRPDGPVYVINVSEIDSIVYQNGMKEEMKGLKRKKALLDNIPQLNTWTYDLLGFTFFSVSQSYERRLKNGKIGFRIPLYIGFYGGGIAGVGTFYPGTGVFSANSNDGYSGGFSIATGLNPKFYLFKRRIVRAFVGPEATIGYSKTYLEDYNYSNYSYTNLGTNRNGTVAGLVKFGLMLNPLDKFNITVDGGAGVGDSFGGISPLGVVGLWHIGLALGTNF